MEPTYVWEIDETYGDPANRLLFATAESAVAFIEAFWPTQGLWEPDADGGFYRPRCRYGDTRVISQEQLLDEWEKRQADRFIAMTGDDPRPSGTVSRYFPSPDMADIDEVYVMRVEVLP